MFGWQRRTETRESLREETWAVADQHARAVLADAMSQIDKRLAKDREDRSRVDLSTQTAIESLRFAVVDNTSPDLGPVLAQVAEMCALVAARIEEDRLERQALTEAITLLARASAIPLASTPSDAPPRVIGGTVLAASEIPEVIDVVEPDPVRDPEETIDLRDDLDPRPVEADESPAGVAPSDDRADLMGLIAAYVPQSGAPEPSPSTEPIRSDPRDDFENEREERSSLADIDLRPHHGTRLTARRSNASV